MFVIIKYMKHLDTISTDVICSYCKKTGFYVTTPCGADSISCPLCYTSIEPELFDIDMEYCTECCIMYECGSSVHSIQGCTESVYNAIFISEYIYEGKTYIGMPQFENVDEFSQVTIVNTKEMCSSKCIKSIK